jgi:hypothetical protein
MKQTERSMRFLWGLVLLSVPIFFGSCEMEDKCSDEELLE